MSSKIDQRSVCWAGVCEGRKNMMRARARVSKKIYRKIGKSNVFVDSAAISIRINAYPFAMKLFKLYYLISCYTRAVCVPFIEAKDTERTCEREK